MRRILLLVILIFIVSCSYEGPSSLSEQKTSPPSGAGPPGASSGTGISGGGGYVLKIVPVEVTRNTPLQLLPQGFQLAEAEVEWLVNGRTVGKISDDQILKTEARKGDTVQAKALLEGREVVSNIVSVKNALPEISNIRIMPEIFRLGDNLSVVVSGSDIDGDEVTFTYQWLLNDVPAGNDAQLPVEVKRGDKISVKVTPFDGETPGRTIVLHREIKNMPPAVAEDKKFNFDGTFFTYRVKASDPDNDTLTYAFKSAPLGMMIDPSSGQVTWNVPQEFKGKATFTVSVTDGQGGEAIKSYNVAINEPVPDLRR